MQNSFGGLRKVYCDNGIVGEFYFLWCFGAHQKFI